MIKTKNYDEALRVLDRHLVYNLNMVKTAEFRNVNTIMLHKHHYVYYNNPDYKALAHIVETPFKHCTVQLVMQELVDPTNDLWVQNEDFLVP